MCGLVNIRSLAAGSSSSACTALTCTCQAPAGSSSTDGPAGSRTLEPPARNGGSHSTRCRTTSRAVQPGTGAAASHERVPFTLSVKTRPISRCRWAGWSDTPIGEHLLQLGVTVVDAGLHAAGEPGVTVLEAVGKGLGAQAGAPAAQVFEPQRSQGDSVRLTLPRERLHDPVGPDLVETAAESVLLAAASGHVPPA